MRDQKQTMDTPQTDDKKPRPLRYRILEVLRESIKHRHGNSPSERQLLEELQVRRIINSYSALRTHLALLQAEGAISRLEDGTMIVPDDAPGPEATNSNP